MYKITFKWQLMSPQHYNSVNGTNKLAIRTVFKNLNCNAFHSSSTFNCNFDSIWWPVPNPWTKLQDQEQEDYLFFPLLIVDTRPTEHVKIGLTKLSIHERKKRFCMRVLHFSTFLCYPLQNNTNKWSKYPRNTWQKMAVKSILVVNLG